MIEDLDPRDLRQQALIDGCGLGCDQRPRLRSGVRGREAERGQQRERAQGPRHFVSGCGAGSGLRGSIASRIAA